MIKKFKSINLFHVLVLIIMLLSAGLLLYLATQKEGMHLDEYLTYSDANRSEGIEKNKIYPEYGIRVSADDVFNPVLYADSFSLKNVYSHLSINIHPPLYYIFIHTICFITNNFLALKTGILLNIVIHMINIGLVWLIMRKILSGQYVALAGTMLFAFLPIILGNVLFVRSYVMVATFILGLTSLFVGEWDKTERKTFYIKLGLISVGGTLTHYYFLIYLFYSCVVWGIFLLSKRRWKELAVFLGTMFASGIICVIAFPAMLTKIFLSSTGTANINNAVSVSPLFKSNIISFASAINELYGGLLLVVILVAVAFFAYRFVIGNKEKGSQIWMNRWLIVFFPCVLYLLTVTKIATLTTPRYIAPVYGLCVILLMGLFDKIVSLMTDREYIKWIGGVLLCGILLNNSYDIYTWPELHTEAKECVENARKYGINNDCIYVLHLQWHSFPNYQEFVQYQRMVFIKDTEPELLYTEEFSGYDHVVMYFDKNTSQEIIDEILAKMIEMNPGLEGYEKLHEYSYTMAYYLE